LLVEDISGYVSFLHISKRSKNIETRQLMIYLKINGSREIENDWLILRHQKYPESFEMWC
jgi:hypothetical protein